MDVDYVPGWLAWVITVIIGSAGLNWFRAWLENKRLGKKEFRDVLVDRIANLEAQVAGLYTRLESQRGEISRLETENKHLVEEVEDLKSGPAQRGQSAA